MGERICPPWFGYFLLIPLRKRIENPDKMLGPFVREGMVVLEPGCGMGYFSLPLARMVGPSGRVVAMDIQPKMLSVLGRRAEKAGLRERIDLRCIGSDGLGIGDLSDKVDFAAAVHVVHEVGDKAGFFTGIWGALKSGANLLIVEPKGHVPRDRFETALTIAQQIGFRAGSQAPAIRGRVAVLTKP